MGMWVTKMRKNDSSRLELLLDKVEELRPSES